MDTNDLRREEHEAKLAARNASRLTEVDRILIFARMGETVRSWRSSSAAIAVTAAAIEALVRVGLGSIGCGTADMRDSELAEVYSMAEETLV